MAKGIMAPDTAMAMVWSPMRSVPTEQGDKSVTTSMTILFNDAIDTTGFRARRMRIYNTDSSATIGLRFFEAGTSVSGTLAGSVRVGPGMTYECVIGNNMRVAAIASSGTVTVNVLVHDA